HDGTGFSIFGTISTSGAVTDRFGVGNNFDALAFVAEDLGYGPNLFYYLRRDGTGFSIFGTISTSGAVTDRFGVGNNFDALTFAAGNQGYGLNLFYYLRHVPYRVFLAADDRQYLVSLKLRDSENCYSSMVEPTTRMGCLFEPSRDGIPGDLLFSGDRRFFRSVDTQGGNFVEGRTTVLESMVRCTGIRAECLAASRGEGREVLEQIFRVLFYRGI